MTTPPLPTLRACHQDDIEGFPIIGLGRWMVETVGMAASDVADCCGDERLAKLFAASPDMAKAAMAVADDVCAICCPVTWKTDAPQPHHSKCTNMRAALKKAGLR